MPSNCLVTVEGHAGIFVQTAGDFSVKRAPNDTKVLSNTSTCRMLWCLPSPLLLDTGCQANMNETQVCVTAAVSNSATPDKNVLSKCGGVLGSRRAMNSKAA